MVKHSIQKHCYGLGFGWESEMDSRILLNVLCFSTDTFAGKYIFSLRQ